MRNLVLAALVIVAGTSVPPAALALKPDEKAVRERLNKIFYWQIADELKLSPKQEKDLIAVIEEAQKRREDAFKEREASLEKMRALSKTSGASASNEALGRYQKSLQALAALDSDEHERLKGVLGPELLVRYYVIRDEVTGRVRRALEQAGSAKSQAGSD